MGHHMLGEIAALGTAVAWSACAIFLTSAAQRIGSFSMSHYRMPIGIVMLMIVLWFATGSPWPHNVSFANWFLLGLSGVFGFFLCDTLLLQSYVDLSPRIGISVFNLYPFISALLAWLFLSETLSFSVWLGIAVTVTGVAWIVLEKTEAQVHLHKEHLSRGLLFAATAAGFQSIGLILAKPAMLGSEGVDPLTATLIRALFGGAGFWGVSLFRGRIRDVLSKAADLQAMKMTALGSFFGIPVGVWLSMIAIKHAPIGIASTLMALMPLTILPMTIFFNKEKVSYRAVIGAIVTCLGVALLFNS